MLTNNPNSSAPVTPINQWSCTLAALSWNLHKIGHQLNQDTIISLIGSHFPHWTHHLGIMGKGDILSALTYLRIGCSKALIDSSPDEILRFLKKYPDAIGFVFTTIPSNHSMAIDSWDANEVVLMDAARPQASFQTHTWKNLERDFQPIFLVLAQ